MIRHCVLFRVREDVSQQQVTELFSAFEALVGQIDGLESVIAGQNVSTEGLDQGLTNGFTADFTDTQAVQNYLVDPRHTVLGARLVALLNDVKSDLIVWDVAS